MVESGYGDRGKNDTQTFVSWRETRGADHASWFSVELESFGELHLWSTRILVLAVVLVSQLLRPLVSGIGVPAPETSWQWFWCRSSWDLTLYNISFVTEITYSSTTLPDPPTSAQKLSSSIKTSEPFPCVPTILIWIQIDHLWDEIPRRPYDILPKPITPHGAYITDVYSAVQCITKNNSTIIN